MKLPNGFGTVYKLQGKRRNPWVARKTIGWKLIPDKKRSYPIYQFVGYYPTKGEALQALAIFNKDPYDTRTSVITFTEVYNKWSDVHYPTIKSAKGYKAAFKTSESLHNMKLIEIKLDHLQKVVDESGKNTPTLKILKNLWGLMWDYAVIHEIVTPNKRDIIKYVNISKAGNPNAYSREIFSKDEIKTLWGACEFDQYVTIVLILIYTGCRIGELLDLKKKNVHLKDRWFYVEESKTEAGIREVPIAEKIVPFFEHWMQKDCNHLICTPDKELFKYRNYYDSYWIPLMLRLGMGKFIVRNGKEVYEGHRPHDTRHTCVSLMTEKKVDSRIIKKIVGHKGQGITETVYTHLELPVKLEAINLI